MKLRKKLIRDNFLLAESLEVLERTPCAFWACKGPTLRPIDMVTCIRCELVAKLQKRFRQYTPRKNRKSIVEGGEWK